MTDAEKVIKALELCSDKEQCCRQYPEEHCPYENWLGDYEDSFYECTSMLAKDALAVLEEQKELIHDLTETVKQLNQHIVDIGRYMTPYGTVTDVKAAAEMIMKAEAIVPCKDCGCFRPDGYCEHHHMAVNEEFYCADGYK